MLLLVIARKTRRRKSLEHHLDPIPRPRWVKGGNIPFQNILPMIIIYQMLHSWSNSTTYCLSTKPWLNFQRFIVLSIKMKIYFQRELAGVHREMPAMHELHGEGDVRIPEDIENIDAELEGDCLKNWENWDVNDRLIYYFLNVLSKETRTNCPLEWSDRQIRKETDKQKSRQIDNKYM